MEAEEDRSLHPALPSQTRERVGGAMTLDGESVGEIVRTLARHGLERDTLVVFTTDNGYFHGEHGLADKWYPYEESIRVPLIVWDPRMPAVARGTTDDALTLNVDLAPTILAAARIAPYALRTPVKSSAALDALSGASLFFKCENLQVGGAFKFRGAINAVFALDEATAARGVITHSSGNHGAALARAAARGVPVVRATRVDEGLVDRNVEVDDDALGLVHPPARALDRVHVRLQAAA